MLCNVFAFQQDMSKVFFLCLFYSVIFPSTFLIGSLALGIQYWADKYCVMRVWSATVDIGTEVSQFNRLVANRIAVIGFALSSTYLWSAFPFDNLCEDKEEGMGNFKRCDQNWFNNFRTGTQGDWMTEQQQWLMDAYGWVAFSIVICFVLFICSSIYYILILPVFKSTYKPHGQDMQLDLSSLIRRRTDIQAYVPQVHVAGVVFPYFACDIDGLRNYDLLSWDENEQHKYADYNLINDVDRNDKSFSDFEVSVEINENMHTEIISETQNHPIFSIVKYWPDIHYVPETSDVDINEEGPDVQVNLKNGENENRNQLMLKTLKRWRRFKGNDKK